MIAAIELNDRAISASSPRPVGCPGGEIAGRELGRGGAERSKRRAIERASSSAADDRRGRRAAATARIFTSAPMWNITQPESSTAASGSATDEQREAGQLEPDGRQQPQARARRRGRPRGSRRRRRVRARSRVEPVADAPDRLRGGAAGRVVLDLLAQPPE